MNSSRSTSSTTPTTGCGNTTNNTRIGYYRHGILIAGFALSCLSLLHQVQHDCTITSSSFWKDDAAVTVAGGAGAGGTNNNDDAFAVVRTNSSSSSSNGPLSLCQRLQGKSVPMLWEQSKSDLLRASLHPSDAHGFHTEWMSALLNQLSSTLLHKGLLNPPRSLDLQRVMHKIQARMMVNASSASSDAASAAPIVQVGVFGGSVTQGSGCSTLPDELKPFFNKTKTEPKIGGTSCAWPTRLQLLCDYFLGKNVIHITNLGVGGTSSGLAKPILKYRFFGNEYLSKHGFDIIINGYAVNDNFFQSSWTEESRSHLALENFNAALQVAQDFYRQARTSRPCAAADTTTTTTTRIDGSHSIDNDAPVVIYVNEYIGNQNEVILGENLRHLAVKLVSEYYDFMYVSYTHVIQRFVYRRSNETLFSPKWGTVNKPKVEAHFGMPGHVLLTWVIAYSALESVVDYCNHQQVVASDLNNDNHMETRQSSPLRLVPDTSKDDVLVKSLPPLLHNATWSTISETWQQDVEEAHDYCGSALGGNVSTTENKPCSFAFLANPLGTTRTAASLKKYLAKYTTKKKGETTTGWSSVDDMRNGWTNKVGVVPTKGVGSKITLSVSNLQSPVRLVTIHSMKSYGTDWNTSIANFKLSVFDNGVKDNNSSDASSYYETNFNVTGWHNQQTSIGYAYEFDLGFNTPAQVGKNIELEVTLLQGIKFKIMAIMMCSR